MNVLEQKLQITSDYKFKNKDVYYYSLWSGIKPISPTEIKSIYFIEVNLWRSDPAKMIIYYSLQDLLQNRSNKDPNYYFIDIETTSGRFKTKLIEIDDYYKVITFCGSPDFDNGWDVYFNSKESINLRTPLHDGYHRFWYNSDYRGVEFFVALSSLFEIIKNTDSQTYSGIVPEMDADRRRLKNVLPSYYNEDKFKYENESGFKRNNFSGIIGLDNVKKEIEALEALASIRLKKLKKNIPVSPTTLHMVFTGNPGTGKTTVARLIGEIYRNIGLLKSGHVVEVTSGDLEGKFVGHSAPQTKEIFEKAIDGVLFIDEAYSLLKPGNNFGKEVINMLVSLMENNRDKVVVIVAGYPIEMTAFLDSNIGLRERFSTFIAFDDFSKQELKEIFIQMIQAIEHEYTDGLQYKFEYLVDEYYDSGAFKSNARTVRNIFETMQKNQSLRLSKIDHPSDEELITFVETDLPDTL